MMSFALAASFLAVKLWEFRRCRTIFKLCFKWLSAHKWELYWRSNTILKYRFTQRSC